MPGRVGVASGVILGLGFVTGGIGVPVTGWLADRYGMQLALSSLAIPLVAFAAGLGDHRINTALCPGGKERMRRLMNVVASGRVDLGVMVTHQYKLDDIVAAYELFANQRDGVLKIAIKPH